MKFMIYKKCLFLLFLPSIFSFPVRLYCKEPGEGCPDILEVSPPVLLTAACVHHEVGGVLQPVQDEADQVGLEVDGEEGADIDGSDKDQVTEADTDEGPGHLHISALYLSPSGQNSNKNIFYRIK